MERMNDLSELKNVDFHLCSSDYGNCVDLAGAGIKADGHQWRYFLARMPKEAVAELAKAIQEFQR